MSYAKFGLNETTADEQSELHEFFQNVDHCAHNLLNLVNDLLDLAKLEAGRMSFEFQFVDVGSLAKMVIDEFRSFSAERNATICYQGPEEAIAATIDPDRIQQVLRNLLSNALKFSPPSGTICVQLRQEGKAMLLSVRDEGPGIPPDEIEAVFDKFVQSSKTKSNHGGTGLGLAICREIVNGHQGRIWVENNEGAGCVFFVELPLGSPELLPSDSPAELNCSFLRKALPMNRSGKILIVDDDARSVDILCRLLRDEYILKTVSTGNECLAEILNFKPQLVLLDIMMPGISGHETCRRIKFSPMGGSIRIILVSAKETIVDNVRGSDALADDYLLKPFDHEELLSKVRAQFDALDRECDPESAGETGLLGSGNRNERGTMGAICGGPAKAGVQTLCFPVVIASSDVTERRKQKGGWFHDGTT